jgi:hypothetical protein
MAEAEARMLRPRFGRTLGQIWPAHKLHTAPMIGMLSKIASER